MQPIYPHLPHALPLCMPISHCWILQTYLMKNLPSRIQNPKGNPPQVNNPASTSITQSTMQFTLEPLAQFPPPLFLPLPPVPPYLAPPPPFLPPFMMLPHHPTLTLFPIFPTPAIWPILAKPPTEMNRPI